MSKNARTAEPAQQQARFRERLVLPRPSARATAAGILAAILQRVAPNLLIRYASNTTQAGLPPFPDLLRIADASPREADRARIPGLRALLDGVG